MNNVSIHLPRAEWARFVAAVATIAQQKPDDGTHELAAQFAGVITKALETQARLDPTVSRLWTITTTESEPERVKEVMNQALQAGALVSIMRGRGDQRGTLVEGYRMHVYANTPCITRIVQALASANVHGVIHTFVDANPHEVNAVTA